MLGSVSEEKERRRRGWYRRGPGGCGSGCGGAILVLTVGLLLCVFNTAIGVGVSARIPFTGTNVTLAGAIGQKAKVDGALPTYVQEKLASNQNFINQTSTLTIWVAEGAGLVVIGHQDGSPAIDLHLVAN